MTRPVISVVLPARNVAATIDRQLDALAAQDFAGPWELIVVDNVSTDATVAHVESHRDALPSLTVLHCSAPGISNARNLGVRAARADRVALCDGDDEVSTGWLRALVEALDHADVVGGPLDTELLNDEFLRRMRPIDFVELPTSSHRAWATGANMAFRRTAFDAIGGFEPTWRYAGEDIDFWWRAQYAGSRPGFAPQAVVHYRLKDSWRAYARQTYHYERAVIALTSRHSQLGYVPPWRGRSAALRLPRRTLTLLRVDRWCTRVGRWDYARNAAQLAATFTWVIQHREVLRRPPPEGRASDGRSPGVPRPRGPDPTR